jgi:hypothetical protein
METRKIMKPASLRLLLFGFICLISATVVLAQEQPTQQLPTQEPPAQETPAQEAPAQEQPGQEPAVQEPAPQPSAEIREDFSDDELKSFVKANEKVTTIQMASEQKLIKAIEAEGLTVNRFNEILERQRDPQRTSDSTATAEEMKSFNSAAQVILQENAKIEKEMTSSIEEEGIDIETYKQIMVAYQQSPQVQTRVNKLVNKEK